MSDDNKLYLEPSGERKEILYYKNFYEKNLKGMYGICMCIYVLSNMYCICVRYKCLDKKKLNRYTCMMCICM